MRLSIATGNTGGVYYPYGGGLAKVIGESLRVQATAEVTAATVDNLKLIQQRKVDIAFALADTLDDGAARDRAVSAHRRRQRARAGRALPELHPRRDDRRNGIERLADLRGRVVSTGSPGSGTEVIALRIAARGRSRSGSRHPAPGAVRERVGGCDQGRQDRRVLLERRTADGVDPRSGELDRDHREAAAE